MQYHLNFNFVWKYFDKLSWGLVLSLELALVSILIGMAIGLALALAYTGGGRAIFSRVTVPCFHAGGWYDMYSGSIFTRVPSGIMLPSLLRTVRFWISSGRRRNCESACT